MAQGIEGRLEKGREPVDGSQCKLIAKIDTRIMASQKFGMATPSEERTDTAVSAGEPPQRAAATPRGIPATIAITSAPATISNVFGSLSAMLRATGTPESSDRERSPRAALVSQCAYCTTSGWSSP